jgi:gliding motility-associated-like protein
VLNGGLVLLVLTVILQSIPGRAMGQPDCPNSNFSSGNFSYWDGYYGDFYNPEAFHGFVSDPIPRHLIIKSPGSFDPNTGDSLFTLPPGDSFCARLGNDNIGAEAEELRYSFQVTSDNNLFIYKYAVVLEDPGHEPAHQPSFTIEVRNQNGILFDPQCGYYYVYAQPGLPGWHTCTNINGNTVVWKDWTTVGLDLSKLEGQTVTIVFITRDCEQSGHFGYAYLTTRCDKLQLVVGFCVRDSTVTVTAPPGFSYLWNNGETTQTISIVNAVPGMVDSCRLTAVNGCEVTIKATINPTILKAGFDAEPQCSTVPVHFTDKSTINQNSVAGWAWDFGDGTILDNKEPSPDHAYANPGLYMVSLIAYSSDHCTDTVKKPVTILPKVAVDLGKDLTLKWYQTVTLDAGNPGSEYTWSSGQTTQSITTGGEQTIWVRAENEECADTDTIIIHELPRCIIDVPTAFSPNGDGQNDILYVYGSGFSNYEFLIFDRSGELVFRSVSAGVGWDGSYKGRALGTGVFNYLLTGTCTDGDPIVKKGNITLLR